MLTAIAFQADVTSTDLDDVVLESPEAVVGALAAVGEIDGLPASWLVDATAGAAEGVVFDHAALTVLVTSDRVALGMAAVTARTPNESSLRHLAERVGVRTANEIGAVAAEVLPGQTLSDRSRAVLQELFPDS